MSDFGLATKTFFGHAFGKKIQFFLKITAFFFKFNGFLLRNWLGCLAELAGWIEGRKRKEEKGGGKRRKEEEGGGERREQGGSGHALYVSVWLCRRVL